MTILKNKVTYVKYDEIYDEIYVEWLEYIAAIESIYVEIYRHIYLQYVIIFIYRRSGGK